MVKLIKKVQTCPQYIVVVLFILFFLCCFQQTVKAESLQDEASSSTGPKKNLTEKKQFNDWYLKCITGEKNKEKCLISQSITGKKNKVRLALISINYPRTGEKPILTFYVPLGISLVPGLVYNIDTGNEINIPLRVCTETGCIARTLLDQKTIAVLQTGRELNVSFFIGKNSKKINLSASLIGFTKAFAALSAKRK